MLGVQIHDPLEERAGIEIQDRLNREDLPGYVRALNWRYRSDGGGALEMGLVANIPIRLQGSEQDYLGRELVKELLEVRQLWTGNRRSCRFGIASRCLLMAPR